VENLKSFERRLLASSSEILHVELPIAVVGHEHPLKELPIRENIRFIVRVVDHF
jgi:hypothetical protein